MTSEAGVPTRSDAAPDAAGSLIEVHKTFFGTSPVTALRGVSLDLPRGSLTAVMGQSRSGKSTLLHIAGGLDTPTRGRVIVDGQDTGALTQDQLTRFRRTRIGFVYETYNLISHLDVVTNVELPLILEERRAEPARLAELVDLLGLSGLEQRLPGELSGGQVQQVAIARALVTEPVLLLVDEPTGALDPRTGAEVLDLLQSAARRLAQTVVLVTHDSRVAAVAERVVFLADGLLVEELRDPTAEQVTATALQLER